MPFSMSRSSRGQVWWRVIRTRSLLLGDSPNRGGFGLTLQSVKMHVDFSLYIDRDKPSASTLITWPSRAGGDGETCVPTTDPTWLPPAGNVLFACI